MMRASAARRQKALRVLAWAGAVMLTASLAPVDSAWAQQVAAASADSKSKTGAEKGAAAGQSAERSIAAAVLALESGKADSAVQQLTAIISGGKLPTAQMARALYYRGVAHRKQGKPAQAIADLTSALWIKNGLDASQRNEALLQRAGAYRDAGLTDQAEADEKRVAATQAAPAPRPSSAQGQSVRTAAANPGSGDPGSSETPSSSAGMAGFFSSLFGGGQSQPSAAPANPSQTLPAAGSPETWNTQARTAPSRQAAAPVVGWADATDARKSERPVASSSWTTGSTVTASPPAAVAGAKTTAARAPAEKPVARASAPSASVAAQPSGGYHLQVAAVRSQKEAQAIVMQVGRIKPDELKGRAPHIDEAVMGNMGTLYRVRLGPYAEAAELRSVCARLRSAGLDCLILNP